MDIKYKDIAFKIESDFYGEEALITETLTDKLPLNPTGRKDNEYYIFVKDLPIQDQLRIKSEEKHRMTKEYSSKTSFNIK